MTRRTVLFVCHNHPSVRPGGAENYAYELFEALIPMKIQWGSQASLEGACTVTEARRLRA